MKKTLFFVFSLIVLSSAFSSTAFAGVLFKPSFGIGTGEYLENSFTEVKVGGAMHWIDLPFA